MNHVQALESRQLLSATVVAAKAAPKPVIPSIIGKFKGSYAKRKPVTGATTAVSVTFTAQTKAGAISGTESSPGTPVEHFTGTINAKDQVVFKYVNEEHALSTITAVYHPGTHVLSGTYAVVAVKGRPAQSGIFSIKLVK